MRDEYPGCARTTGSKKVDDYVWAYVKQICRNPQVIEAAIYAKLAELEQQNENLDAEIGRVESELANIRGERQWVITQARKGRISEQDMEMQLQQLETQTYGLSRELEEYRASASAKDQLRTLTEWARQYLGDIQAGIAVSVLSSGVILEAPLRV